MSHCKTCNIYTPPRAYHCKACNVYGKRSLRRWNSCVRRYDHHCPYMSNCIGLRNYRFFYAFLVCPIHLMAMNRSPSSYLCYLASFVPCGSLWSILIVPFIIAYITSAFARFGLVGGTQSDHRNRSKASHLWVYLHRLWSGHDRLDHASSLLPYLLRMGSYFLFIQ